jgi:AraC-like DNA-binding protein
MPEYAIFYITRGQGEFESQTTARRTVTAGHVILLFPGVWHRYRPGAQSGWTRYAVAFNGGYPKRLVQRKFITPEQPVLDTGLDDAILRPFLSLLDHVRSEPLGLQQLIAANSMEILGAALAAVRSRRDCGKHGALVNEAKLILEQRAEESVSMQELATSLHISYERFRHLFAQQTGLAPYQYHLQLRINRAKQLLHGTTLSVRQVAAAVGFNDPYHFSKIFKKHTGVSPTQWRGNADTGRQR